jgi:thioredoxin-like negative regulator of GroEL
MSASEFNSHKQNSRQLGSSPLLVALAAVAIVAIFILIFSSGNTTPPDTGKDTNNGVPVEVNSDAEYTQLITDAITNKQNVPLLIYFCSPTLSDCQLQTPVVEKLAKQYNHQIKFVKVDVEKWTEALDRMQITRLPHMIYLDTKTLHGAQTSGFLDEAGLQDFIKDGQNSKQSPASFK